jgi:hypothetical protein
MNHIALHDVTTIDRIHKLRKGDVITYFCQLEYKLRFATKLSLSIIPRVQSIEILGLEVGCIYACRTIKTAKNDEVNIS